jgi:hypothetical protein
VVVWGWGTLAAIPLAAQVPVSLEVVTAQGFPLEGQQSWMESLKQMGFTDLRMRAARPGDEPTIVNRGTDDQPRYVVTGVLARDNRLEVPGLIVRYGQRQQLADWLARLRAGGEDTITGEPGAFGLTAKQFAKLHDAAKSPIDFPTKGQPARNVIRQIIDSLAVSVEIDPSAQAAAESTEEVLDELQGLSRGTALAAAVRPLGMVVTVTGQGQSAGGLRITRQPEREEVWPLGLPPTGTPDKTAPALFKFLNVEIHERPLAEAVNAIQERLKIPFLFDHNALAKHEVDLQTVVSFPAKNTFYKKILDDLLYQARLRSELRVDDAQRPFLWITTIKK